VGPEDQLDKELESIENDDTLTQKEKNKAMREAEMGYGDAMHDEAARCAEMDGYSRYL